MTTLEYVNGRLLFGARADSGVNSSSPSYETRLQPRRHSAWLLDHPLPRDLED